MNIIPSKPMVILIDNQDFGKLKVKLNHGTK